MACLCYYNITAPLFVTDMLQSKNYTQNGLRVLLQHHSTIICNLYVAEKEILTKWPAYATTTSHHHYLSLICCTIRTTHKMACMWYNITASLFATKCCRERTSNKMTCMCHHNITAPLFVTDMQQSKTYSQICLYVLLQHHITIICH